MEILVSGSMAYDRIMQFGGYFRDHFLPGQLDDINVSFAVEGFSENFGGDGGEYRLCAGAAGGAAADCGVDGAGLSSLFPVAGGVRDQYGKHPGGG